LGAGVAAAAVVVVIVVIVEAVVEAVVEDFEASGAVRQTRIMDGKMELEAY
jgi:hypothetical protein